MDKRHNVLFALFIVCMLVLGSAASAMAGNNNKLNDGDDYKNSGQYNSNENSEKKIKNIIVMVPDGCDQSVQTLARWYSGEDLQLDSMVSGMVKTYMADSIITDSASAATAFSTGYKTSNGFLSVGPNSETLLSTIDESEVAEEYVPLATVLEGAKLEGKATGLVATSEIPHATPAAFASHVDSRKSYDDIIEQMVYENIDVVFAGGEDFLNDSRGDGENLIDVLESRDYQFITTADELKDVESRKVWGMFAGTSMSPEMSRTDEEPTIAEMTTKAIDLLSEDQDGFFLMVEGSQVDWAGHANDATYMVTDFLAFDEAVEAAVDFAEEDGHTLVIVFPDHNTGGLTIGNDETNKNGDLHYTELSVEELVDPLMGEEGEVVVGWTTGGHCGDDVPLWSYGPDRPIGLFDNTELATYVADAFGFVLDDVSDELFVDVEEAFPGMWELDTTDAKNPVLVITYENKVAELPVNKNVMTIDGGEETELNGVVVYAPKADDGNGKVFIPQEAVDLLKSKNNK
ncbi:alkaline phosphatase [Methanolobus sediminis]|uniref:Alkaline phosphatase n=1 Tax=Methanolobus sediminis TaxID=3072978 RepID=A0AA51UI03_9EURY|nr:alkaline phosphatase [Methanolobus sediminis]WMW23872.1 alkaline phosphatase [Methanolobus sediminis]